MEKKNVLVVDDEELLREVLVELLEVEGYNTFQASSGQQAYEVVEKETIDLVISDVRMPQGTGIELFKKVSASKTFKGHFILMSGYSDLSIEDAYAMGVDAYFLKPFHLEEIQNVLKKVFSKQDEKMTQRQTPRSLCDFQIEFSIENLMEGVQARVLNVGRGGMFIAQKGDLPRVGAKMNFTLRSHDDKKENFEGVGIVRWVREKDTDGRPAGFGISFEELNEQGLKELNNFIEKLSPTATIPNGVRD